MTQRPPEAFDPTECVSCGYELAGLPEAHRCPECGIEYDTNSIAFRPSGRFRLAYSILTWWAFGSILIAWTWTLIGGGVSVSWWAIPPLLYVLCAGGKEVWLRLGTPRKGEFLLLTSERLILRRRGMEDVVVPWSDVSGVRGVRFFEQVRISVRERPRPISIPRDFWPKSMPFRAFADLVTDYHRRVSEAGSATADHAQVMEPHTPFGDEGEAGQG